MGRPTPQDIPLLGLRRDPLSPRQFSFCPPSEDSISSRYYWEIFVDILHHAAIGYAGAMSLAVAGQPLASVAFLAASVLPDADIVYMARGKRAYLKAHQSTTHSALLAAFASLALGVAGGLAFGPPEGIGAGLAFLAGFLVHVLLDASNTLGTHLLWPFGRRVRLDAVFFIDALSWGLTLGALATLWATGAAWPILPYALAMILQILFRAHLSRRARAESDYPIAIPDPVLPWAYSLTRPEGDGSASIARWTPRRGLHAEDCTPAPSLAAIEAVTRSEAVEGMSSFARALTIVEEERLPDIHRIVLRDVAMRRLGARYGEITLTAHRNGDLDEHINI